MFVARPAQGVHVVIRIRDRKMGHASQQINFVKSRFGNHAERLVQTSIPQGNTTRRNARHIHVKPP